MAERHSLGKKKQSGKLSAFIAVFIFFQSWEQSKQLLIGNLQKPNTTALYHNKRLLRADPCCRSVIKEFAHAFSYAYIELWMHLGSSESTQKARVALGCASSYSYSLLVLSKLPACIYNSIYAR